MRDINANAPLGAVGYGSWGFPRVGGDGCHLKGTPRYGSMVKILYTEVWVRFGVQRLLYIGPLFSDIGILGISLERRCRACLGI